MSSNGFNAMSGNPMGNDSMHDGSGAQDQPAPQYDTSPSEGYGAPQSESSGQSYAGQFYGAPDAGADAGAPGEMPYGQGAPFAGRAYSQQTGMPFYGANGGYGAPVGTGQYPGGVYGQYPQQPAYYAPVNKWNTMSIIGFVLSFVFAPAGLILSIIALREVNRSREQGKAFAIAGIVISAVALVILLITIIIAVIVVIYAMKHPDGWSGSYCVNGECHYKDYGDTDFSAIIANLKAALMLLAR